MSPCNDTSVQLEAKPSFTPRRLLCDPAELKKNPTCRWATSWRGVHPVTGKLTLFGSTCKRWGCPYCANVKIKRLAWLTAAAKPNRALTLTTKTDTGDTPRQMFETVAPKVSEFVRALRKRFGEIEYLRVTEAGRAGFPHFHLLLRSDFLPHKVMKQTWKDLTGFSIIYVQKVTDTFRSYYYLTKYLSKMSQMDWTDRHVSYSRQFFPEELTERNIRVDYENVATFETHPLQYLAEHYPGEEVEDLGNLRWELPYDQWVKLTDVDPRSLDLPPAKHGPYADRAQTDLAFTDPGEVPF